MPYPAQIDLDTILKKARDLIEESGVDALSLGRLATELNVKAPSLYRHVANKDALIQGVGVQMIARLFEAIEPAIAAAEADPAAQLMAAAGAYRAFAHASPRTFVLAMTEDEPARQPDPDYLVQLILPLQAIVAEIVGEQNSLPALRGLYALMHGFVLAELTGQFRRGGDLDAAFESAVAAQIRGWQRG